MSRADTATETKPVPLGDASLRLVIEDALASQGMKLPEVGLGKALEDASKRVRYDHDAKKFSILDDAGHPQVFVDSVGAVRDLDICGYVAKIAKATGVVQATASASSGVNPWHPKTVNRTQQALMQRDDPEGAARMKAEAELVTMVSNPWSKTGWNRTQQILLRKSNPERAQKLASEAGVAVDSMRPAT